MEKKKRLVLVVGLLAILSIFALSNSTCYAAYWWEESPEEKAAKIEASSREYEARLQAESQVELATIQAEANKRIAMYIGGAIVLVGLAGLAGYVVNASKKAVNNSDPTKESNEPQVELTENGLYCSKCGKQLRLDDIYCSGCGTKIEK